jgi:hypothetical protein
MRATIQKLSATLGYCEARTDNEIMFVFIPPSAGLHVGDVIQFDHTILESAQTVHNVSTGGTFTIHLRERDIHDLRLSEGHGTSRLPSQDRFDAA